MEDYLLWHHFGKKTKDENMDLVHAFKQSLHSVLSPRNLSLFINSYLHRTDLQIQRPNPTSGKKVQSLKCACLLITGANSPHQDDVIDTNSRLDPSNSNYFKVSDSGGMPLEEQPHKVATSLILFLQGLGYCKCIWWPTTQALTVKMCFGKMMTVTWKYHLHFSWERVSRSNVDGWFL